MEWRVGLSEEEIKEESLKRMSAKFKKWMDDMRPGCQQICNTVKDIFEKYPEVSEIRLFGMTIVRDKKE